MLSGRQFAHFNPETVNWSNTSFHQPGTSERADRAAATHWLRVNAYGDKGTEETRAPWPSRKNSVPFVPMRSLGAK